MTCPLDLMACSKITWKVDEKRIIGQAFNLQLAYVDYPTSKDATTMSLSHLMVTLAVLLHGGDELEGRLATPKHIHMQEPFHVIHPQLRVEQLRPGSSSYLARVLLGLPQQLAEADDQLALMRLARLVQVAELAHDPVHTSHGASAALEPTTNQAQDTQSLPCRGLPRHLVSERTIRLRHALIRLLHLLLRLLPDQHADATATAGA